MRPGPHPWATDDTYTTAPDAGSDNKLETTDMLRDEGAHRSERLGPDLLNWQLNREYLSQQMAAKMMASNFTREDIATLFAGDSIDGSTHLQDADGIHILTYAFDAAGNINEIDGEDARSWSSPASNPISAAGAGNVTDLYADANDANGRRTIVAESSLTDQVYTKADFTAGAWSVPGGLPGFDWLSVCSDRDTAGDAGTQGKWLIGEDGQGGGSIPEVWASTDDCANFAKVTGFPSWAVGQDIRAIFHSCHPAGALGPDDPGNPHWLVFSTLNVASSADGVSWTSIAEYHKIPGQKGAAYSRTSRRWVTAFLTGGTATVYYSDDNGATWLAGQALPNYTTGDTRVVCDGYGTFMIHDSSGNYVWVSSDEGMTWTCVRLQANTIVGALNSSILEVGCAETLNDWKEHGQFPTFFTVIMRDDSTGEIQAHRSLVY